ncbi:Glucose-6-phosphate isomerase [Hondaea fermentalgiana]|uniref:Glucose-6-phosphate isomerase n=1 Tax=Hondaea fermentalgiana TaxID=2315210 RepID=A0A2R5G6T7_9STRA|nr:Glucose-6-phosphate isomerase [Hondaea fermentalgiana]|eukprot:GBG24163.1 Glucose-6-phosphate isomerase [Hondaea fermentalgiana]
MSRKPGPPAAWETDAWSKLEKSAAKLQQSDADGPLHLRQLIEDEDRCEALRASFDGITMDYSRQKLTTETVNELLELAEATHLKVKMTAMASGKAINTTEGRAVMHMALRAPKNEKILVGDSDVVPEVHEVLDRVYAFAESVRSGEHKGATGKKIDTVISIGIGGSYLGPEFVFEALRTDETAAAAAQGRTLKFLANVDPVDVARALSGVDPETTLVVVVSKTFTTAETMLNARTLRRWLEDAATKAGADKAEMIAKHMIAVSAAVPKATDFGIAEENVFGFWDWVGGRYSVCSAVGVMPLALQYGPDVVQAFLDGAWSMDEHFLSADFSENLPVLVGLIGVWNATFLEYNVQALLPYSQALLRFPAHIQQVSMESNGKRVTLEGEHLPIEAGEIVLGEPGTNGQHSFYQLIHQGRVMACDFIGSIKSQQPIDATAQGEDVSNHDELMANFFAQPDALATGKTIKELEAEGVPKDLLNHKEFPGNRPSTQLLFPCFDAKRVGQLLSLYENSIAVKGFIWGVNSFDQWGVELGKVLAKQVRGALQGARAENAPVKGFNPATTSLLKTYLEGSSN